MDPNLHHGDTEARRTSFIEQKGDMLTFDFVCEGCRAEGRLELNISELLKSFGCPELCGATYILWKNPLTGWDLRCVVCPVFEDNP